MKKHPIQRIENAKRHDPRVSVDEVCKILLEIYPPVAKVEMKAYDQPIQIELATFLQYLRDQSMINEVFGEGWKRNDYLIIDSELLNYTQISNVRLTASLWKQERNSTTGKGVK